MSPLGCYECAWGKVAGCWRCGSRISEINMEAIKDQMMSAHRAPGPLGRGFLGNGSWFLAVHTKKCARLRRRVTPAERARSMVPNHNNEFVVAMRERAFRSSR